MNFFKRIIFIIKAFFWKRKINKIYGYKYGKLTRDIDMASWYPHAMSSNCYYVDTDSVKKSS